jgi:ABC-type transport system involved in cytochrome bd biosynthesis fused ATPase/permease subunit
LSRRFTAPVQPETGTVADSSHVVTEATIMDAMSRLMKNRTTFMIADRLGTLDNCDLQIQIKEGRLTEARMPGPAAATPQMVRTEA